MIKSFIDIKTYRNYLEDFYVYPCDEKTKEQRKKYVDKYSDKELEKIIEDTKFFIEYLLDKIEKENKVYENSVFTSVRISSYFVDIFTNCVGGYNADILYNPLDFDEEFFVSKYLLKEYLREFMIYEDSNVSTFYDEDDDIGYYEEECKLVISTKIDNFKKIKNKQGD